MTSLLPVLDFHLAALSTDVLEVSYMYSCSDVCGLLNGQH